MAILFAIQPGGLNVNILLRAIVHGNVELLTGRQAYDCFRPHFPHTPQMN
jgi:hypothetical protein